MNLICNYEELNLLGESLKADLDNLDNVINKTQKDIDKIRDYYNGNDCDILMDKYKDRIKYVNSIIYNLNNYKDYFINIAKNIEEINSKGLEKLNDCIEPLNNMKDGDH